MDGVPGVTGVFLALITAVSLPSGNGRCPQFWMDCLWYSSSYLRRSGYQTTCSAHDVFLLTPTRLGVYVSYNFPMYIVLASHTKQDFDDGLARDICMYIFIHMYTCTLLGLSSLKCGCMYMYVRMYTHTHYTGRVITQNTGRTRQVLSHIGTL